MTKQKDPMAMMNKLVNAKLKKTGSKLIQPPKKNEVPVTINVSIQNIADNLISAFEGGSNYWYEIVEFHAPKKYDFRVDKERIYKHADYPVNPGGSLKVKDTENSDPKTNIHELNIHTIRQGLAIMAKENPRHFGELLREDGDAETADVFLQCCVLGKCIYG